MVKSGSLLIWAALALAGSPIQAAEITRDDWQSGNLIANGDFRKGTPGRLPEGWTLKAPNPALRPEFKMVQGPARIFLSFR
jgi:hypothetical protein